MLPYGGWPLQSSRCYKNANNCLIQQKTKKAQHGFPFQEVHKKIRSMVELLADFPPHVAAYRASGKVHKEEYEKVVMRRVDEVAAQYGKINFLVRLETGMEDYSLAALIDYLKVSFEHFSRWNRMAIVSDQQWLRKIYDALSPLVPGRIETYELKNYEAAKKWVSAPLSENENKIR